MDIRGNVCVYWLFTKLKASGIYDSVSIILIESINQLRTARLTKYSLTKIIVFLLCAMMIVNRFQFYCDMFSGSMIVKWLIQYSEKCATSPSRFVINNSSRLAPTNKTARNFSNNLLHKNIVFHNWTLRMWRLRPLLMMLKDIYGEVRYLKISEDIPSMTQDLKFLEHLVT